LPENGNHVFFEAFANRDGGLTRAVCRQFPYKHAHKDSLDQDTMWGLAEALTGSAGKAHTIAQCRSYFVNAGFADITDVEFVPNILHRVCGFKA
jgi:hypothetical protein